MELHFYPGQDKLVVIKNGALFATFEAKGGPKTLGTDPRMQEEPTWPGEYIIDQIGPYRTPTWPLSRITWGTRLKDRPGLNDIWYELPSGKWASVRQLFGNNARDTIMNLHFQLYGKRLVPDTWLFNDFGPTAIRWFKDLNKNKIVDGKEVLSGQMFHTTPDNEAQTTLKQPVRLMPSHGCIHLKPEDRNRLMAIGAFTRGTTFTVHHYHERY